MGLSVFKKSSLTRIYENTMLPNDPKPDNFKIVSLRQIGKCVLGIINYPNATNFEGDKVLVWGNTTVYDVRQLKVIDPHFLKDTKIIARFRPTSEGYRLAKAFCNMIE